MQVTGVLDECFFYEGPLGVSLPPASDTLSIGLWAPTAQVGDAGLLFSAQEAWKDNGLPQGMGAPGGRMMPRCPEGCPHLIPA